MYIVLGIISGFFAGVFLGAAVPFILAYFYSFVTGAGHGDPFWIFVFFTVPIGAVLGIGAGYSAGHEMQNSGEGFSFVYTREGLRSVLPLYAMGLISLTLVFGFTFQDHYTRWKINSSIKETGNPDLEVKGEPVIFTAIEKSDLGWVKQLEYLGADLYGPNGYGGATPVLDAALSSRWEICLYLLEKGADPLRADMSGFTVVNVAFERRKAEVTSYIKVREFLVKNGMEKYSYPPKVVREMVEKGEWPPK